MKKTSRIWALLIALFLIVMLAAPWSAAMAEGNAIDTTEIITQVVIWVLYAVLTALGAVATWAIKNYIIPWLRDVAVPWLKQHKLLTAAQTAVEYAEAMLGRYTGDAKWELVQKWMKNQGYDIDDEAVIAALKAKCQELDLQQSAAGIKEIFYTPPNTVTASGTDTFAGTDQPVSGITDEA